MTEAKKPDHDRDHHTIDVLGMLAQRLSGMAATNGVKDENGALGSLIRNTLMRLEKVSARIENIEPTKS